MISALSAVAYGGYTYFRNILPPLAEVGPDHRYTVLVKTRHLGELTVRSENIRFVAIAAGSGSSARRTSWEQAVLPGFLKRWGADVVYTANNVGLLRCGTPVVIAVRNLEPFFHTEYEDGGKARARNRTLLWLTKRSVERAARVVAVSEYTKEVVSARCGHSGKMRVVYHGRPEVAPNEEAAGALRVRYGLDGEYFLANSKFVTYSNLHTLIEGYGHAVGKNPRLPKLVLAGGDASRLYKERILGAIRAPIAGTGRPTGTRSVSRRTSP